MSGDQSTSSKKSGKEYSMNLFREHRHPRTAAGLACTVLVALGHVAAVSAQTAPAAAAGQPVRPEGGAAYTNPTQIVPADTLSKPTTPSKATGADGFIQRWILLEPISVNGLTEEAVQSAVKKDYFPNQFTVVPHDGDTVRVGDVPLTWHAEDTKHYNLDLYQFARAFGKPTSNVLFWAVTIVNSPQEMQNVRLAIGSNSASVWWVNGQEVIGIYGDRQTVIDDGVSRRLTLKKGPNIIRAAVVNGGGATDFCARFLDAQDKPLKEFTVSVGKP
jgi:hypothetical protein